MQETGNKSNNPYSLSIRFYTDGFSFFICNPQSEKNFLRKDYPVADSGLFVQTLAEGLASYAPLQERKYTIVSALFHGPVSRVPLELFHKDRRQDLYELVCPLPREHNIHYNILPHLELAELFLISSEIEQLLLKQFPTIHFYAQNAMVLERAVQRASSEPEQTLYAYFYERNVFLFHYRNKKVVFANEFTVTTEQDVLYYILNVWKSLGLDPQKDVCVLIQPEHAPGQTAAGLSRYLRHLRISDMGYWFGQAPLTQNKDIPFDILSLLLNGF